MMKTVEVNNGNLPKVSSRNTFGSDACCEREDFEVLVSEVKTSCSKFFTRRPLVAGGIVFMVGFYLGWKVKPW